MKVLRDYLIERAKETSQKTLFLVENKVTMTYKELYMQAAKMARRYKNEGVKKGDLILIQSATPLYTYMGYWGALLLGATPALYPINPDVKKHIPAIAALCKEFGIGYIFADKTMAPAFQGTMEQKVFVPEDYEKADESVSIDYLEFTGDGLNEEDTAMLQFSSGSTGNPKGVLLTHKNIVANALSTAERIELEHGDYAFNWLPLSHDFAMLAMHMIPIVFGCNQLCMMPNTFLRKPMIWAKTVSECRANFSPMPTFAMNLIAKSFNEDDYEGLDLSSMKAVICAGEGVSVASCDMFYKTLAPYGFKENAVVPAYGLAEATVTVTLCDPHGGKISCHVASDAAVGDKVLGDEKRDGARLIIGCGMPISCNEVLICDDEGKELSEGFVGNIMVRGENVTKGYYKNPEATADILGTSNILNTGDIGFIYKGQLFISGRRKEMIIINGRNYFSSDIEATVKSKTEGLMGKTVAAFQVHDCISDTEKLYIAVEGKENDNLAKEIKGAVVSALHIPCERVVFDAELPKTASGKVRYYMLTKKFEAELEQKKMEKKGDASEIIKNRTDAKEKMAGKDSISRIVYNALSKVTAYPVPSLNSTDKLQFDLGIDSIMMGEIVAELTNIFSFDDDQVQHVVEAASAEDATIEDLVKAVENSGAKAVNTIPESLVDETSYRQADESADSDANDGLQSEVVTETCVTDFDEYKAIHNRLMNLPVNPYYKVNYGVPKDVIKTDEGEKINYSTYNYVGLNGNERVKKAAQEAVARYGTSVSGSRMISGEIDLHRELENTITEYLGTEDTIVYIGGYTTNVSAISTVVSSQDLILHDSLSHNSLITGCILSGAKRMSFKHNDMKSLEDSLKRVRKYYRRVLIVAEGIYSMDGDICDLPKLVELKKKYGCLLMIDEAHSLGTIGDCGRGVGSYYNIDRKDVDMWMGTMSKSLASCGGYISGSKEIVELLKYTSDGFMFSVGISPANAAAALEAIRILKETPELVSKLKHNSDFFLNAMKEKGLDTGLAQGTAVVPCIIGDSNKCMVLSQKMYKEGINVMPIVYPAVSEEEARLRFFISSEHTEEEMQRTVDVLARLLSE